MLLSSQQCPTRLRATLANFRSYCQKTFKTGTPISCQKVKNTSLTKYRSIRQIRNKVQKIQNQAFHQLKKEANEFSFKKDDPFLSIKHTDLIQMIKLKLKQGHVPNERIKTEQFSKEDNLIYRLPKKSNEIRTNFVQPSRLKKSSKKKKIDLSVTNTRLKLIKRQDWQYKNKQIVIALRKRPASAMNCQIAFDSPKNQIELRSKYSNEYIMKQPVSKKSQVFQKKKDFQRYKDLSAWQIQNVQQIPLEQEVQTKKKRKNRKSKVAHKSAQYL